MPSRLGGLVVRLPQPHAAPPQFAPQPWPLNASGVCRDKLTAWVLRCTFFFERALFSFWVASPALPRGLVAIPSAVCSPTRTSTRTRHAYPRYCIVGMLRPQRCGHPGHGPVLPERERCVPGVVGEVSFQARARPYMHTCGISMEPQPTGLPRPGPCSPFRAGFHLGGVPVQATQCRVTKAPTTICNTKVPFSCLCSPQACRLDVCRAPLRSHPTSPTAVQGPLWTGGSS